MLKIKEEIVHTIHQDGTVVILSLLDTENCYYKVNGISKEIFTAINSGKDLQTVRNEILDRYNVDEVTLDKDIEQFVTYLKANNIVEEK